MREILFRGKQKENGEWIYGGIYSNNDEYFIINDSLPVNELGSVCNGVPINPETVGQYTGLKDKNGTMIFEGDVIPYNEDDSINLIVEWSNDYLGYFVGLGLGETIEQPLFDFLYPEVIGNIHDNPELIKL